MLLENTCLPVSDDRFPDDKADCCNNPCIFADPDKVYNMKKRTCYNTQQLYTNIEACGFDQTIKIIVKLLIKWMRLEKQKLLDLIFGWIDYKFILVQVNIQRTRI